MANDYLSANVIEIPTAVDYDSEFANHLQYAESLDFVLREGVESEVINSPRVKAIYQFASHHYRTTGKAPTRKILADEFTQFTWRDVDTPIEWVVDKLRQRYKKNKIESLVTDVAKAIDQPDTAMTLLEQEVREIQKNTTSMQHVWSKDDGKLFIDRLNQRILEGGYTGVSTGFQIINDFTGGLKKGQLGYILARPKRQKSWFMLNTFIDQIKRGEKPVLFTLENSDEEMMLRLACLASGYPWDNAQRGALMGNDKEILKQGLDQLGQWGEFWLECPVENERTVDAMVRKAERLGAESILISQFKYIDGSKDWYRNPQLEVPAEVAVDLKRAARRANVPILVEAQFNRGGDSMEELEDFDASKVGLTDMIPQAADILFGLFQSKELRENQQVEFGILESRDTDKAAWYIHYEYRKNTELKIYGDSQH